MECSYFVVRNLDNASFYFWFQTALFDFQFFDRHSTRIASFAHHIDTFLSGWRVDLWRMFAYRQSHVLFQVVEMFDQRVPSAQTDQRLPMVCVGGCFSCQNFVDGFKMILNGDGQFRTFFCLSQMFKNQEK